MLLLLACAPSSLDDTSEPPEEVLEDRCDEIPAGQVVFPDDERPHDEGVEWWYWTGHLQDDQGRWYGFEEVFFLFDYGGDTWQMANHAITDVDGDAFAYDLKYGVWDGVVPEAGFAFSADDWTVSGVDGADTLRGTVGEYELGLGLTPEKAPVLQHGDGYTDYEFGGYTFYYSRTRMAAEGTLQVGGESRAVSGTAWFDHQWGDISPAIDEGWDWFAISLDDGREVMLFVVRAGDEPVLVGGTIVGADCTSEEIPSDGFTVTATGSWTTTDGCTYPSGWDVTVGEMAFTVTPVREDQELAVSYNRYWEGAATVAGDATGRAYVELTGYCE